MSDIFKYSEGDPRFVNCQAVKYMSNHNQRVSDAATARAIRFENQRKAYAVQVVVPADTLSANKSGSLDWFKSAADRFRQAGGSFRMLNFRLRLGRLLIEFQSAGRSLSE
jgi:hypothetical protein